MKQEAGRDEVTIIGNGVVIEGKITSNGNVRIDGKVNGDIIAAGNITVGETGEIGGQLKGDIINVGGIVIGTVSAKEKLVLESKSHLKGDLITKILVIDAGAVFEGKSTMNQGNQATG